jgi:hypothetical protein
MFRWNALYETMEADDEEDVENLNTLFVRADIVVVVVVVVVVSSYISVPAAGGSDVVVIGMSET